MQRHRRPMIPDVALQLLGLVLLGGLLGWMLYLRTKQERRREARRTVGTDEVGSSVALADRDVEVGRAAANNRGKVVQRTRNSVAPIVIAVRGQVNEQLTINGGNDYRLVIDRSRIIVRSGTGTGPGALEITKAESPTVLLVSTRPDKYRVVRLRGTQGQAELRLTRRDGGRIAGILRSLDWTHDTMWS